MENKDSIELWIKTSKNVNKTIKIAMNKYDTKTIINLLSKFREATQQLEKLLEINKEERFTA
tara:strand:+ start:56 stop:241 length:186 start_codon:yes stop_codon:yes gene_type:complete